MGVCVHLSYGYSRFRLCSLSLSLALSLSLSLSVCFSCLLWHAIRHQDDKPRQGVWREHDFSDVGHKGMNSCAASGDCSS